MFEEFVGAGVLTEVDPIRIGYEGMAVFGENSEFPPSQEDVDILILTAFQEPNVSTLLGMLQALPAENPFSGTTSVQYIQGMQLSVPARNRNGGPARTRNGDSGSSSTSTATVVAIVGAFVLAFLLIGLVLRRRLRARDSLKKYLPAPIDFRARDIECLEAEESYCISYVEAASESRCTSSVGAASDLHSYCLKNDEQTQAAFAPEADASRRSSERDPIFKNPLLRSFRRKYKAVPRKLPSGQDNDTHRSYATDLTSFETQSSGVYQRSLSDEEETEIEFLPDSEASCVSSDRDDYLFKTPFNLQTAHNPQSNEAQHRKTEMTSGLTPANRCEL
jgi:hypothetical protein